MPRPNQIRLTVRRDTFGQVLEHSWGAFGHAPRPAGDRCYTHVVGSTREMSRWLIQYPTSVALFRSAWAKGVSEGAIPPSRKFTEGDDFPRQGEMDDLKTTVEGYISELVNNPRSRFYIYG